MRILSFVGTRPEIIKSLAFCHAATQFKGLEFLLAHTGQNFGETMADCFFEGLNIPTTHRNTGFDRSSVGTTAKSLMDYTIERIEEYRPDVIISNTDTDSAFYAALAAARRRVPVAHIEGGIRCEERLNPEELNRKLADHVSDWIFTISDDDTASLVSEGIPKERIFMLGDITLDVLQIVIKENRIAVEPGAYDLLTIHRQENASNPERLSNILKTVAKCGFPTVFPIHPRTRETLEKSGLMRWLETSRTIRLEKPQNYVDMCRLVAGSRKVLSDSGGLRREAYMLKKPVISLVSFVWFKEMNRLGFEHCAGADPEKIRWAIENYDPKGARPALFGDGNAGKKILEVLVEQGKRRG